jgi:hypothetical protein
MCFLRIKGDDRKKIRGFVKEKDFVLKKPYLCALKYTSKIIGYMYVFCKEDVYCGLKRNRARSLLLMSKALCRTENIRVDNAGTDDLEILI